MLPAKSDSLNSLQSRSPRPDSVKILILWTFFVGVMIVGGYAVYYQTLGIGTAYHNSSIEAVLASLLFVFGIYLLALVLHGFLFSKK
jgi:hypothetical protein